MFSWAQLAHNELNNSLGTFYYFSCLFFFLALQREKQFLSQKEVHSQIPLLLTI